MEEMGSCRSSHLTQIANNYCNRKAKGLIIRGLVSPTTPVPRTFFPSLLWDFCIPTNYISCDPSFYTDYRASKTQTDRLLLHSRKETNRLKPTYTIFSSCRAPFLK